VKREEISITHPMMLTPTKMEAAQEISLMFGVKQT
jgi:hypothetical protein